MITKMTRTLVALALVVGGMFAFAATASAGTRVGSAVVVVDGTRVGASLDGTRVGASLDGTRVGASTDGTRVGAKTDGTRVG